MKFKENWEEIIRDEFGVGNDVIITNVEGDVDFCSQLFSASECYYIKTKKLQLGITKHYIYITHVGDEDWHKTNLKDEDYGINITKEEFLEIVEGNRI